VTTPDEQSWLTLAFSYLKQIDRLRSTMADRSKSPACFFRTSNVTGIVYMQFLARFDSELLLCEAVSAESNPALTTFLTLDKKSLLHDLGFEPPNGSPNYEQQIKTVESDDDIAYVVRLAFRVFKQIYEVKDFASATFEFHFIPRHSSSTSKEFWRPASDLFFRFRRAVFGS
jgi:hypothetical protein